MQTTGNNTIEITNSN